SDTYRETKLGVLLITFSAKQNCAIFLTGWRPHRPKPSPRLLCVLRTHQTLQILCFGSLVAEVRTALDFYDTEIHRVKYQGLQKFRKNCAVSTLSLNDIGLVI